jgi:hypothetical protein
MERWSVAHRAADIRFYYETKPIIQTQRHFRHGAIPSCNTILMWIRKFQGTGSVRDIPYGTPRTVRTEENVRRVRE